MRRNGAKTEDGAAAIATLVIRGVVAMTEHRGALMMRVDRHFGITADVLMLALAMPVVVAVLMLLCVLVIGLVSALSS